MSCHVQSWLCVWLSVFARSINFVNDSNEMIQM